ncbi:OsmC family protein [Actinocatenispora comari]|jgi:osmotically inducible protein OsmC|uniref:Peroxiredoxin n=1 Tax=Actinocatenispora comari TaxID=2807577 RepID=A0A8J4AM55_9ACTN|nr:OsmC family protein [Actinocatenispora comari]GIL31970.1 peroxiredoxin [Actinocatenispora comari]
MPVRKASAEWRGGLQDGAGRVALGSGAYEGDYSYKSRFGDGSGGTNPEELIGAAHAACFSMALSNLLATDNHPPTAVQTTAEVTIRPEDGQPTITSIALHTVGTVPGLTAEQFAEYAEKAKAGCPVSRALAGTTITLDTQFSA